MNKTYLRDQALIFENPGTIVRRGVLFQEKGLPGELIEKEIVERRQRFPKCSLFKYRLCVKKVKEWRIKEDQDHDAIIQELRRDPIYVYYNDLSDRVGKYEGKR